MAAAKKTVKKGAASKAVTPVSNTIEMKKLTLLTEVKDLAKKEARLATFIQDQLAELDKSVQVKELETQTSIANLEQELEIKLEEVETATQAKVEKAEAEIEVIANKKIQAEEDLASYTANLEEQKAALIKAHTREIEDLQYQQKVAIRDQDGEFLTKYYDKYEQVLVNISDYDALQSAKDQAVKEAGDAKKNMIAARSGETKAKNELENAKKELDAEKQMLLLKTDTAERVVDELKATIAKLEAQLAEVPAKLIEAAKASAPTINQTK